MVDRLSPAERSAQMSRIRGSNTAIELTIRRALHSKGFRYRLGGAGLPGRPDLVLPKYRAVVLIHGCFWHGHTCKLFRYPATREEFWRKKIDDNRERDRRAVHSLLDQGWRVAILWECRIRKRILAIETAEQLSTWLKSEGELLEI